MIELLQIIFILSLFRFAFRVIFFEKKIALIFTSIFIFVVSLSIYPRVLQQSGDFYTIAMQNKSFVQDLSVIITFDAILGIILSILLLRIFFKRSSNKLLDWFLLMPDFLIIGFIAYLEQQMFYIFTGNSFFMSTLILAVLISIAVVLLSLLINKIIPDKAAKYELNFITNIFILMAAIALNTYTSSYNTVNYQSKLEWKNTLLFFTLATLGFVLGFLIKRKK